MKKPVYRLKTFFLREVVISSLGAIMDVGMSVVSSLYEIYHHNPTLTAKDIFRSGIEIGKDMIGNNDEYTDPCIYRQCIHHITCVPLISSTI